MKQLRVGVIGTGHMGRNHVRILADEKRFDLIGVYDADEDSATSVADAFGTIPFLSADELLQKTEAVVIAVPSFLHKEVGLKAASYNVHSLIEKPLATSLDDAESLALAFSERNLVLQVGHIERFNPVILELEKIVRGGAGKVFYAEAHRYSPFSGSGRITDTSVIEDLMIHDVDLICNLMSPAKVTDIRGNAERIRSDANDFATCMLNFSANAHAVINASRVSQNKERSLEIHTEESIIFADLLRKTLTITRNTDIIIGSDHAESYRQDAVVQSVFVPAVEPLRMELKSFYETVAEGKANPVDADAAMEAIRICEEVASRAS